MKYFIEAMRGAKNQMLIPAREVNGKILPEVLLPRFHYYPDELNVWKWQRHGIFVDQGTEGATRFCMRQAIEMEEDQWEACQADVNFMGMLKKGAYVQHESLPLRFRNHSEEQRILLAKYREALEKAGIPVPELEEMSADDLMEKLTAPDKAKTA
jgi:hypothetical protein